MPTVLVHPQAKIEKKEQSQKKRKLRDFFLVMSGTAAALVVGIYFFLDWLSLPLVYYSIADGSCVIVVEQLEGGNHARHDCGWEIGRRHRDGGWIDPSRDLSDLYD